MPFFHPCFHPHPRLEPEPCAITLQWHRRQALTWGPVAESGCCHTVAKLTGNQTASQPTCRWQRRVFSLVCPKFLPKSLVLCLVFLLYKQRKRLNSSFAAARLCLHMENSWKIALLAFSIVAHFPTLTDEWVSVSSSWVFFSALQRSQL